MHRHRSSRLRAVAGPVHSLSLIRRAAIGCWVVILLLLLPLSARAQTLTVFAAASLTDALRTISDLWQQEGHPALRQSFASSSTLARQIEQGAPANLFASADEKWMDYLAGKNLIAADTRVNLLSNDLVLIVPANKATTVQIGPGFDIASLLGANGRLATGDPAHVPAGIYAAQSLRKLGLWDAVANRLARTDDVRGALLLVERGEAPAGIVYGTDAKVSTRVAVAGVFPRDSHDPITYPFAVVKSGDTPQARDLLHFLGSRPCLDVFAGLGFHVE